MAFHTLPGTKILSQSQLYIVRITSSALMYPLRVWCFALPAFILSTVEQGLPTPGSKTPD